MAAATTTAKAIVKELASLGSAGTKQALLNHGIKEPFFGVNAGDLTKIRQRIKTDWPLAIELHDQPNLRRSGTTYRA